MSQSDKAIYFRALKRKGVNFPEHYRTYSTEALKQAWEALVSRGGAEPHELHEAAPSVAAPAAQAPPTVPDPQPIDRSDTVDPAAAAFFGFTADPVAEPAPQQTIQLPPVGPRDPNEMAGARVNTREEWEPIRTDELGRIWYQEEVKKPAYPKPRGRRVMRYQDPGVVTKTVVNGDFTETFEVSGDPAQAVTSEIKITLPSYQVGVYADPRFPFRVVTYNGNDGFMLEDVQDFYGGSELVPAEVKRMYVENVLCYDVRSVVRAIETEYRAKQLDRLPS